MVRQKKRILFVSHTAEITGPAHSLAAMLAYLKDRYETAVLVSEEGPLCEWLRQEGIPAYILADQKRRGITRIITLLRQLKPDLVYGNNPNTFARNALVAARLLGRPYVWHFRSVKWHWGWREGIFLRWADRVIAVSRATALPLQRFIPEESIRVIYNGVEPANYHLDREQARQYVRDLARLGPQAKILISVGHLQPRKWQTAQVEIMRRLAKGKHDVHLLMAGNLIRNPGYVEEVRKLVMQYELEHCVHVFGLRKDVPHLLAGADLFLHTPNQDAHPRAVIEAMAAGLPVVAFGVGGVSETVKDGVTGCLLEPGDFDGMSAAIAALLDEPGRMAAFGERGQQRVQQHYTAQGTARQIDRVLQEVLERQRG